MFAKTLGEPSVEITVHLQKIIAREMLVQFTGRAGGFNG